MNVHAPCFATEGTNEWFSLDDGRLVFHCYLLNPAPHRETSRFDPGQEFLFVNRFLVPSPIVLQMKSDSMMMPGTNPFSISALQRMKDSVAQCQAGREGSNFVLLKTLIG